MKNKGDGYYGSRDGSSERRRSSRRRRRSRSSRDKSEYRSMTRSRSRERYRRKFKSSRSSSSSSSGSSSSSSRSRKGSPPYRNDNKNRRPVGKGGFPFSLPASGQYGGEPPRPEVAPWFDGGGPGGAPPPAPPPPSVPAFPPPAHRTPPAPPPPSIDLTSPPPAPTFDSRHIPSLQHDEPRNFPPPNFPPGEFGNNFQGNFPTGFTAPPYYPPGANVPAYPPPGSNQPHPNFNPAEHQQPNPNWNNFSQAGMPQQLGAPTFKEALNEPPTTSVRPTSTKAIEDSTKEAVEQELAQQKRTLAVQREEYFKRKITLTRELTRLKDQKRELLKEDSSVNDRILKENSKLQGEIHNKLKSMDNVIDMLSNIIGDKAEIAELMKETSYAVESPKNNDKRKRSLSRSPSRSKGRNKSGSPMSRGEKHVNVVHYDPELHWCSVCDVFPKTASQYLIHLHSEEHKQEMKTKKKGKREEELMPWRTRENREPSPPRFKNAPSKRVPIRGVQFLVPSTAWYCSMCKVWLGDIDTANRHLKAPKHASIYHEFAVQNPHWEVDWLTERTRAYERNSDAKTKSQSVSKDDASPKKNSQDANDAPKTDKSGPTSTAIDMANFGDRLLAMLAASSKSNLIAAQKEHKKEKKTERKSSGSSSGSSSDSEYEQKKKKKKKKKEEKKKRKGEREHKKEDSSKGGKKFDQDENESEANTRFVKKRYTDEHDDRVMDPSRNRDSKFPDRSNRGKLNSGRAQQFSKDFKTGPKNVKAGPEFPEKDFHGPGKNSSHDLKTNYSGRENSFYGPKEPPKKEATSRASKESERKMEEEKRPKGKLYVPGRDDDDEDGKKSDKEIRRESSVDKKSSETVFKKKEVVKPFLIPKTKLPFIGRMPILKKKIDPKPPEPSVTKQQPVSDEVVQPPIPKSKLSSAEPVVVEPSVKENEIAGLPKSTLIITKRQPLSEPDVAPKVDDFQEQDMEIEDEPAHPPSPPPQPPKGEPAAPIVHAEESAPAEGSELHKDFKDALDLLFPEQKTEEQPEPEPEVKLTESEQITQSTTSAPPQTYQTSNYGMYQQSVPPVYDAMGYYDQTAAYHQHMQQQQMSYMAAMGYDQSNMNMFPTAVPPPGFGPMTSSYPPPAMMAPQLNAAFPSGVDVVPGIPPLPVEPPAEHPPGIGYHPQNSDWEQSPSEAAEENAPPKKKNAPGQRLRRHFRKKAMQAEALKDAQPLAEGETAAEEDGPHAMVMPCPKVAKLRPEDLSELALLGIEEGDITAQSFY